MADKDAFIQTYTGTLFTPFNVQFLDISIFDIAHALANQCRFGGHVREFYSVAQHSIIVASFLPDEYKFEGLMHDAAEAYLVDIPRPIKYQLPQYREWEGYVEIAIATRFNLIYPFPPIVKEMDHRALVTEQKYLMPELPKERRYQDQYQPQVEELPLDTIVPMSPKEAETLFITLFYKYRRMADGSYTE